MNSSYDVVIAGGGPAGYTAALYSARAGFSVLVLEMLNAGGQMSTTSEIDNYPGFENGIDGFELGEKMQAGAERFGVVSEFAEITGMELSAQPKVIHTTSGDFFAKAVVIATGASPRKLGLADEAEFTGRGVAYCATCDGMQFKDRVVAVSGGGNSAAAEALTLSKICKQVYLIHRRDTLRASASYLRPLKQAGNITFLYDTVIDKLVGEGKLTGLALVNKKTQESFTLSCDGLFVAIGRVPNTQLVKDQLALDKTGYIMADESTKTNLAGVFAAGDVRTKPLRQIVTAASDGALASYAIEEYFNEQNNGPA